MKRTHLLLKVFGIPCSIYLFIYLFWWCINTTWNIRIRYTHWIHLDSLWCLTVTGFVIKMLGLQHNLITLWFWKFYVVNCVTNILGFFFPSANTVISSTCYGYIVGNFTVYLKTVYHYYFFLQKYHVVFQTIVGA